MIFFISSKPSGTPAVPGKETDTLPVPSSFTTAETPQPEMVSLMASRVKLSPPIRSRAARAKASFRGSEATGRRAKSPARFSSPQFSAVVRLLSRCTSSSRARTPSRAAP